MSGTCRLLAHGKKFSLRRVPSPHQSESEGLFLGEETLNHLFISVSESRERGAGESPRGCALEAGVAWAAGPLLLRRRSRPAPWLWQQRGSLPAACPCLSGHWGSLFLQKPRLCFFPGLLKTIFLLQLAPDLADMLSYNERVCWDFFFSHLQQLP